MISIAIDGPAGAGKSTIAKAAAKKLGYIYVDTGALYRAIAFYLVDKNIDLINEDDIKLSLNSVNINIDFKDGEQRVKLFEKDISDLIRTPEISMIASDISKLKCVREFLLDLQRKLADENNVIMDGRDIGTVVLPGAKVKIFLTASAEKRAKRRYIELLEKGMMVSYESVLADIIKRDHNDTTRQIAPLKPSEDSVLIDTSRLNLDESIKAVIDVIEKKVNQ